MQGKKHFNEKLFLNFQLSERVPEDNFYRRLKNALDFSFLRAATKKYYGQEGQSSIDPEVFFKLILVGYLENLNSDRKIIDHARMRMDILFFIGYDIDEELPWHSTLSRTRQLYGEDVFETLFQKVLKLCIDKGMVSGKRQALDSAYIKANASMDSIVEKEVIEDGKVYLDSLRANGDDPRKTVTAEEKREVEQQQKWRERRKQQKKDGPSTAQYDEHGNLIRPKLISNKTHYSETDVDARISTKPGKARQFTYSAQTAVDTKQHVITGILADYSDKRDGESLPELLDKTQKNLAANNITIKEILADSGYSGPKALQYLEENDLLGYIPNHGQFKAEHEGFTYNKEKDQFECLQGNCAILPYRFTGSSSKKGNDTKVYRSSQKDCKNCPFQAQCSGKFKSKKITVTIHHPLYSRMHERMQSKYAQRMRRLRSSTVEPVLGTLIHFRGMRKVRTRGIQQAHKFIIGAAIAYNLKKWLDYIPLKPKKVSSAVLSLEKRKKKGYKNLLFNLLSTQHTPYLITICFY